MDLEYNQLSKNSKWTWNTISHSNGFVVRLFFLIELVLEFPSLLNLVPGNKKKSGDLFLAEDSRPSVLSPYICSLQLILQGDANYMYRFYIKQICIMKNDPNL